jgi:hypothetical protein
MKYKAEHIEWVDSEGTNKYWVFNDELPKPKLKIHTVGYVIKERKNSITVASSYSSDCFGGVLTIPRIAIINRFEVA